MRIAQCDKYLCNSFIIKHFLFLSAWSFFFKFVKGRVIIISGPHVGWYLIQRKNWLLCIYGCKGLLDIPMDLERQLSTICQKAVSQWLQIVSGNVKLLCSKIFFYNFFILRDMFLIYEVRLKTSICISELSSV